MRIASLYSAATTPKLAKRVGVRCSNPRCRQLTSGPSQEPSKAINVGVAAYISGVSAGGPCYDAELTPERG